jgi:uncharacterized protein (TIGR02996 family)
MSKLLFQSAGFGRLEACPTTWCFPFRSPPQSGQGVLVNAEIARFIEEICLRAEDDAPRLAYADWLQRSPDAARAARGEFIRVQCQLARLRSEGPRRQRLRVRQAGLLRRHGRAWLAQDLAEVSRSVAFPKGAFGPYERGFLSSLN